MDVFLKPCLRSASPALSLIINGSSSTSATAWWGYPLKRFLIVCPISVPTFNWNWRFSTLLQFRKPSTLRNFWSLNFRLALLSRITWVLLSCLFVGLLCRSLPCLCLRSLASFPRRWRLARPYLLSICRLWKCKLVGLRGFVSIVTSASYQAIAASQNGQLIELERVQPASFFVTSFPHFLCCLAAVLLLQFHAVSFLPLTYSESSPSLFPESDRAVLAALPLDLAALLHHYAAVFVVPRSLPPSCP
ncbi:UNVERIFIED_CONTAM: hypothetical protein Sangu_1860200 [Sesamum angustifolium]|uniref:Transmembrane protein n=1 Tax=Sesamum angustifolium TaxID=2727405 RepID=A0AAW2MBN0_9LAMI